MIRAVCPESVADLKTGFVTGWNIQPNVQYTISVYPGATSVAVWLFDGVSGAYVAGGAALVGTDQPVTLLSAASPGLGMVDADLGYHLLVTSDGTEPAQTYSIGPFVDSADHVSAMYTVDNIAVAQAAAVIREGTHYTDDVSILCPLGMDAWLGDVCSATVHGESMVGDIESVSFQAGPSSMADVVTVRRMSAILPDAPVVIVPPVVVDDAAETDAVTATSGNVLTNDASGLTVVAVDGLMANVGVAVAGSAGGVFTVGSDGEWSFDPDGDFATLSGSDTAETSVTYHASNGQAEAMAALMVTVRSGSAVAWTPAEITTALWLDASDSSTSTVVSGKISQRADKSGNSRHATQATTGLRPVAATSMDGYDGADDSMAVSHVSALDAPAYIAIVSQANVTGQYKGLLDKWESKNGWMIDYGPAATQGRPRLSVNGATVLVSPSSVHNILCIVEAQISGASSFIGTPTGTTTGILPTPNTVIQDLFIAGDGVSTLAADLDFHELVILSAAPDASSRAKVQGYLAHKWDSILGVTTLVDALPANHPYKSAPPTV